MDKIRSKSYKKYVINSIIVILDYNRHKLGGTILGSSRGGFDADKILDGIEKRGIN